MAVVIAFASCNKNTYVNAPVPEEAGTSTVSMALASRADGTKATTTASNDEKRLASLRVFIFDKNGAFEKEAEVVIGGDNMSATASATISNGRKSFRAIANTGSGISTGGLTLAAFDAMVSDLSDNARNALVMYGAASQNVLTDVSVPMSLERLASKVCLTRVNRQFSDADAGEVSLKVTGVYISNVVDKISYNKTAVQSGSGTLGWYNRQGAKDAAVASLTQRSVDFTVAQGGNWTGDEAMYIYSNDSALATEGGSWSPRKSRLVIETTLGGTDRHYYYTVTLPQIPANQVANVEVTLRGLPSLNPDTPSDPVSQIDMALTANISVSDWGDVQTVSGII